ncbi:MAG TPA: cation:dicarboxylase symporter family transporter, partial [Planctomycetota bacterium]|nr:cation:dicarboxylase symporter family transporter [Planctomycetota bacterium]
MSGAKDRSSGGHFKVLLWMLLGVLVGLWMQWKLAAPPYLGMEVQAAQGGVRVTRVVQGGPAERAGLVVGDVLRAAVVDRGNASQRVIPLRAPGDLEIGVLAQTEQGEVLWLLPEREAGHPLAPEVFEPKQDRAVPIPVSLASNSPRARAIAPFSFAAGLFIALLKMLIVPVVLSSIVAGIAGVGAMADLSRLGGKTFVYYIGTSLLAIFVGQILVNLIRPGAGAQLGLAYEPFAGETDTTQYLDVLQRMVPSNVFTALSDNGAMLAIIFFALLLGLSITRCEEPHRTRMHEFFDGFNAVMMKMAAGVLALLPYGVFALMVKVVAGTGFAPFRSLLLYMFTVTLALLIHGGITLPLVLKFIGRISP